MEAAISAFTGELISRFISLLMSKYSERETLEKKVSRLQQLLLRVHTVVEEADSSYITNGRMLMQLKMITDTMYQGYHVLDTFKCSQLKKGREVSDTSALSLTTRLKRPRVSRTMSVNDKLQTALENIEGVIANMAEFVILLAGCERMSRRPYDTYLYHDNFMFSRHAERQQLTSILLQHDPPGPPLVLPIIGGRVVGKKTLVAHVCGDERVRSYFSSILHLDGSNFLRINDHEGLPMLGRSLVVVEFVSDVDDTDWGKFYSSVASMGTRSKVILISRHDKIARFGTMKPIYLKRFSDEELSYLFKTLAFGSANPVDHPRLVSMVKEYEPSVGSVVGAYMVADVLRKNVNLQFWAYIMKMCKNMVQRNLDLHGEHPKTLFDGGHPLEMPYAAASAPLQLLPCGYATGVSEGDLP